MPRTRGSPQVEEAHRYKPQGRDTTLPAQALPHKSLAQSRPGRDLEEGSPAKAGMAAVHQREREGGEDMQLSHAHGSEQGGGERTVLGQEVLEGPWSQLSLF